MAHSFGEYGGGWIVWRERSGVVHACRGVPVIEDDQYFLVVPVCEQRDVPAGEEQQVDDYSEVNCQDCLAQLDREEMLKRHFPIYEPR